MIIEKKIFDPESIIIDVNGDSHQIRNILTYGEELFNGISSHSLVLLLCENKFESIFFYINCIHRRIVPILADAGSDISLIEKIIIEYNPDFIFVSSENLGSFINYSFFDFFRGYALLVCDQKTEKNIYVNLALLLSTSGTTGSPKLVRLSYENIFSNAKSIASYLNLSVSDRAITSLPMNYSFGLSIINSHLFVGASVVLTTQSITQRGFWDVFKKFNVTSLSGVPFTFEIIKKFRLLNSGLTSLKTLTQAGGKLSNDLVEYFAKYADSNGIRFFVMYGQTEGTARLSYLAPEFVLSKLGSIGKPIPDGRFYIIDELGNTINESGISGELVYTGPNVMLGYSNSRLDLDKGDINCGILKTGDIALFDQDGFYYIVGRIKRFIKIFGNRVNLDELEGLLLSAGIESACIGKDNSLIIYIVNLALKDFTKDFLFIKLGIHFSVFEIRIIDAIPKSNSGKTIYSMLKE